MTNWKEQGFPFVNFTEKLTQEWIDKGFNKEECQKWLNIGMKATEADFCAWLRDKRKLTAELTLSYQDREQFWKDYTNDKNNPFPTNSQIIQAVKDNPHHWRIEEVVAEYDNFGKVVRKEPALVHKSAQIGEDGEVFGSISYPADRFSWHPVHLLTPRFNQNERREIEQILTSSKIEVNFTAELKEKN